MRITKDNYLELAKDPGALESAFAGNTGVIAEVAVDVFKTIFDAIKEAMANGGHFRKDVRAFINLQRQWDDKLWAEFTALKTQVQGLADQQ